MIKTERHRLEIVTRISIMRRKKIPKRRRINQIIEHLKSWIELKRNCLVEISSKTCLSHTSSKSLNSLTKRLHMKIYVKHMLGGVLSGDLQNVREQVKHKRVKQKKKQHSFFITKYSSTTRNVWNFIFLYYIVVHTIKYYQRIASHIDCLSSHHMQEYFIYIYTI